MTGQLEMTLAAAGKRGALAAQSAADAADRRCPQWSEDAYQAFRAYAIIHRGQEFTTEDVRLAAKNVPPAPDGRAWGAIAIRAKREGLVKSNGYRCVVSSNNSPKVLWLSLAA